MSSLKAPPGLSAGGRALWRAVTTDHPDLDALQVVQLTEACRAKDRLDKLDLILRGDVETWATLTHRLLTSDYELKVDKALADANATANLMKQLLAAMRLPDSSGVRPQQRGGARGSYGAQVPGGKGPEKVSSLDRARARKSS